MYHTWSLLGYLLLVNQLANRTLGTHHWRVVVARIHRVGLFASGLTVHSVVETGVHARLAGCHRAWVRVLSVSVHRALLRVASINRRTDLAGLMSVRIHSSGAGRIARGNCSDRVFATLLSASAESNDHQSHCGNFGYKTDCFHKKLLVIYLHLKFQFTRSNA